MNADRVLKELRRQGLIAIIRGVSEEAIVETVRAVKEGGISCVEITFDHKRPEGIGETLRKIQAVRKAFSEELQVGTGTVLTPEEADLAAEAGADYMISPNVNRAVIRHTKEIGKISIPGAFTPSEVCDAYEAGADIVKLFPAGLLGAAYMKAIGAPLSHIPMCAVGGVTPENIADFMQAGVNCFGIGGNLVSLTAVREKNFDEIRKIAAAFRRAYDGK